MPAKKPPPPGTLAFMAEAARPTYVVCETCSRWTTADLLAIARQVGWGTHIDEIGPRLRCLRCKNRGGWLTLAKPRER